MKTVDEIFEEMLACFGEKTGVELEAGCDLAVRLYAAAAQVYALYVQADWVARQAFPQTAEGEYLDLHAQLFAQSLYPGQILVLPAPELNGPKAGPVDPSDFVAEIHPRVDGLQIDGKFDHHSTFLVSNEMSLTGCPGRPAPSGRQ